MNKEQIISEGLIAYITEELDHRDVREVEEAIATDGDVAREFYRLQDTLEKITLEYGLRPSNVVKRMVMEDPDILKGISYSESSAMSNGVKLMLAASIIVALLSVISAVYFWQQWQQTDDRLAQLTARNLELAESYHIINQELTNVREDLAVLVSPSFSRIILDGTDNAKNAKAVIYWNPDEEEVYLNSANLERLAQNQQYQLWALIDGVPVDAGVFDANPGTFQIMKGIAQADAFAVTVEQSGGAETPTLSTMQVYGESS